MALIVYYSSRTENTHHFVTKLQQPLFRIERGESHAQVGEPFILALPTYAGDDGRGAVPRSVVHFLNVEANRHLLRGVIAGGNRSFGWTFGLAGTVIAKKCNVACLYRFELRGTDTDVSIVKAGLEKFWKQQF